MAGGTSNLLLLETGHVVLRSPTCVVAASHAFSVL
jgi:hypothetical protein